MTREQYREHMRTYSRQTMHMSFVVTKHPDYQALREAGKDIITFLLEDLIDPRWYCSHCYGEGFEFPPDWEWDAVKRNWPTDTGIPCTRCNGRGGTNSWAIMMLLAEAVGPERPKIEDWMRGRHDPLVKVWALWGQQNGYLPVGTIPEESLKPSRSLLRRLWQAMFGGGKTQS